MKEAGISNSILLIPNLKFAQTTTINSIRSPGDDKNESFERSLNSSNDSIEDESERVERSLEFRYVKNIFHDYFECREVMPKFRKLYDLLHLARYSGPENEYCIEHSTLFTYQQMLDTLQCSRFEFDEGLRKYHVINIDGCIRMLDIEYEYRLLYVMLGIIMENSWSFDCVNREETLTSISETIAPSKIVEQLFELYTKKNENGESFAYNEEVVCKTIALNLLQQGMKYHYEDFMSSWQGVLPEGMQANVYET